MTKKQFLTVKLFTVLVGVFSHRKRKKIVKIQLVKKRYCQYCKYWKLIKICLQSYGRFMTCGSGVQPHFSDPKQTKRFYHPFNLAKR